MRVRLDVDCRGFALSELMVAFLLLAVVAILLLGVVPATVVGLHKAQMRANAAFLAADQLEQLRRDGFHSIETSQPPYPETTLQGTVYTSRVEVAQASLSNGGLMELDEAKKVQVFVSWEGRRGPQEHVACAVVFRRI